MDGLAVKSSFLRKQDRQLTAFSLFYWSLESLLQAQIAIMKMAFIQSYDLLPAQYAGHHISV